MIVDSIAILHLWSLQIYWYYGPERRQGKAKKFVYLWRAGGPYVDWVWGIWRMSIIKSGRLGSRSWSGPHKVEVNE